MIEEALKISRPEQRTLFSMGLRAALRERNPTARAEKAWEYRMFPQRGSRANTLFRDFEAAAGEKHAAGIRPVIDAEIP